MKLILELDKIVLRNFTKAPGKTGIGIFAALTRTHKEPDIALGDIIPTSHPSVQNRASVGLSRGYKDARRVKAGSGGLAVVVVTEPGQFNINLNVLPPFMPLCWAARDAYTLFSPKRLQSMSSVHLVLL